MNTKIVSRNGSIASIGDTQSALLTDNLKEIVRHFMADETFRLNLATNLDTALTNAGLSCTPDERAVLRSFLSTISIYSSSDADITMKGIIVDCGWIDPQ